MDIDHPDLIDIGARLRHRFEAVLEAEREAAVVAARRRADLRSVLIDAEDRQREVAIWLEGGMEVAGVLRAIGADHLEVVGHNGSTLVTLKSVLAVRFT